MKPKDEKSRLFPQLYYTQNQGNSLINNIYEEPKQYIKNHSISLQVRNVNLSNKCFAEQISDDVQIKENNRTKLRASFTHYVILACKGGVILLQVWVDNRIHKYIQSDQQQCFQITQQIYYYLHALLFNVIVYRLTLCMQLLFGLLTQEYIKISVI
ncbi:Hypothetical_protein [Hexamita inflata]|uniref:Hypothetical_protein n=1 Tax=Hexamita inflata TaxID=28002 RepID=A0AA86N6R9_9EUKA|nr:Hypothetical protein HINF_LOCUS1525 [Hexamita inflata]